MVEWCLQSPQSHISRDLIRWVSLSSFHLLENWGSEKGDSVPEGPKAYPGQVSCSTLLELTNWPHELRSCPAHPSSLNSLKSRTLGGSSDFPTVLPAPNSKKYSLPWYAFKAECIKLDTDKTERKFHRRISSAICNALSYSLLLFHSILLNSSILYHFLFILILFFFCNASLDSPNWFLDPNGPQFEKTPCRSTLRSLLSSSCHLSYTPLHPASPGLTTSLKMDCSSLW